MAAVQQGHVDVGVVDEGIDESHARGTGADDQVVSLNRHQMFIREDKVRNVHDETLANAAF
jgi:hypothetical protein